MTWGPLSVFVKKTMSIEIVIICSEMHFAMLTPSRVGGGVSIRICIERFVWHIVMLIVFSEGE